MENCDLKYEQRCLNILINTLSEITDTLSCCFYLSFAFAGILYPHSSLSGDGNGTFLVVQLI